MFADPESRVHKALRGLAAATDTQAVNDLLQAEAEHYGFRGATWSWLAPTGFDKAGGDVSEEFLDQFRSLRLDKYGPVTRRVMQSPEPFEWSEVAPDPIEDPLGHRIMELAARNGQDAAFTVPIYQNGVACGTFNFIGTVRLATETKEELRLIAVVGHNKLSELLPSPKSGSVLTAREREVLIWTAHGKTSGEISTILGVSSRTVEFHLDNASRKLDTTNRVHTVVEALRRREIEV